MRGKENMVSTASILLLSGLPGCGKSSLAKEIIDVHNQRHKDHRKDEKTHSAGICLSRFDRIVLIDYDAIADMKADATAATERNTVRIAGRNGENEAYHSFESGDLWSWRKSRVQALDTLRNELITHFAKRQDRNCRQKQNNLLVIMDDNFHLRSMRRDVYKACQDVISKIQQSGDISEIGFSPHGTNNRDKNRNNDLQPPIIGFSVLYISTPIELCIMRNNARSGKERVPTEVINRMATTIEPPDTSKPGTSFEKFNIAINPYHVNCNSCDNQSSVVNKIQSILEQAINSPVSSKEELTPEQLAEMEKEKQRVKEDTLMCRLHQIDLLLRKLVGAVGRIDKKNSKKANDARKRILKQVKQDNSSFEVLERDTEAIALDFACDVMGMKNITVWEDFGDDLIALSIQDSFRDVSS
ncbi:hypothetical protein ACHAXS_003424 [Conticribra weissflogii]